MERYSSPRGSALLMVFWAITVMSVCILGLIEYLYTNLDETISLKKNSRAYQLAESGIAIGLHPLVGRTDHLLKQTLSTGEGFEVHLRSEGGRLNINTVLQNQNWSVLKNLFLGWGLHIADASNLANAFKDWSSPGIAVVVQPLANAGQNQPQPVRLFQSVDGMISIPGMGLVAEAKPDWRDYFTIWSDGTLDMNDAPADLIVAVCGVGRESAEEFVKARLGLDGKPDTEDDLVFANLEQVRAQLGMSQESFAVIQDRLSTHDSTTRIESTGTFGTSRRKITAVIRRSLNVPIFLQWQES